MKERKIYSILITGIIFCLLIFANNGVVNAENKINATTNSNTQTTNTSPSSNSSTTPSTTPSSSSSKAKAKSSNANLSDLGIIPNDFKGFKYGTTSYNVSVPEETDEVEVYAKTQDSKAKVTGTGKKKLQLGQNKLDVLVTAEDGTKKTYTINVTREGTNTQTNNAEPQPTEVLEGNGLEELKIEGVTLSPQFEIGIYEYTGKYIGKDTKLKIEAIPTNDSYIVEITGNENLIEGDNIITILVSGTDGENIATYQITINKSLVDEEAIAREQQAKKEKQDKLFIGAIVAIIVAIVVISIFIRYRRNRDYYEDYDEDYEDEYEEDEIEEEIPKALQQKSTKKVRKVKSIEEDDIDDLNKLSKEKAREKYLNNYNSRAQEEYHVSRKTTPHKGKRFK